MPQQYAEFLNGFAGCLLTLAEWKRPDLAARFPETMPPLGADEHVLMLSRPRGRLRWAFRESSRESRSQKMFCIEVPMALASALEHELLVAFERSHLAGHRDEACDTSWRFERQWGWRDRMSYQRLTNDRRLITAMQSWGFDAMCVAIDVIDGRS